MSCKIYIFSQNIFIYIYIYKRGVSYNCWKSGDWALKPGYAEDKIK